MYVVCSLGMAMMMEKTFAVAGLGRFFFFFLFEGAKRPFFLSLRRGDCISPSFGGPANILILYNQINTDENRDTIKQKQCRTRIAKNASHDLHMIPSLMKLSRRHRYCCFASAFFQQFFCFGIDHRTAIFCRSPITDCH